MNEEFKNISLKYGEKGTMLAIDYVFELIETGAKLSENQIDDAFLPALLSLKPIVVDLADKIYKEE